VGALAYARISVGAMGAVVPELNVFNLPFMFRDDAHMEKVIDGAIGAEMLKKLSDHATVNLIGLCWMNAGTRNVYNSKKAISTVADLKGLKIRMMGNPLFVDTMNALGGNGVAMGYDQLINALQTGVVDGAENNYPSYASGQHYRYAKYYSLTGHLMIPESFLEAGLGGLSAATGDHHEACEGSTSRTAQALVDGGEVLNRCGGWRGNHRLGSLSGGGPVDVMRPARRPSCASRM
jgi:hypothetical protein